MFGVPFPQTRSELLVRVERHRLAPFLAEMAAL